MDGHGRPDILLKLNTVMSRTYRSAGTDKDRRQIPGQIPGSLDGP
jgi:hypothetical protein